MERRDGTWKEKVRDRKEDERRENLEYIRRKGRREASELFLSSMSFVNL